MNWNKFIFAGYATICMDLGGKKYYFRVVKNNDDYNLYEIITTDISDPLSFQIVCEGYISRNGVSKGIYRKLWKRHLRIFDLAIRNIIKGRSSFLNRLDVKIYHAGYCAKCNRLLKTPEGIQHGIGNECFKDMNINPKENFVYVGFTSDKNNKPSGSRNNGRRKKPKRCPENIDGSDS